MATLETIDKTASTTAAITRATESHTVLQAANLEANLRLSNLEKSVVNKNRKLTNFPRFLNLMKLNHTKAKNAPSTKANRTWLI